MLYGALENVADGALYQGITKWNKINVWPVFVPSRNPEREESPGKHTGPDHRAPLARCVTSKTSVNRFLNFTRNDLLAPEARFTRSKILKISQEIYVTSQTWVD